MGEQMTKGAPITSIVEMMWRTNQFRHYMYSVVGLFDLMMTLSHTAVWFEPNLTTSDK